MKIGNRFRKIYLRLLLLIIFVGTKAEVPQFELTGYELWAHNITSNRGFEPVISNDLIFICAGNVVKALALESGKIKWEFRTHDTCSIAKKVPNSILFIVDYDGFLYALNAQSGVVIYQKQLSDCLGTSPVVYNNNLYIGGESAIYKLNLSTGEIIWQYDDFDDARCYSRSVYIDDDKIYFNTETTKTTKTPHIHTIDINSGKKTWSRKIDNDRSSIYIFNNIIYTADKTLGGNKVGFVAFDKDTNKKIWKFEADMHGSLSYRINGLTQKLIFVTAKNNEDKIIYALNISTGQVIWSLPFDSEAFISEKYLFVVSGSEKLLLMLNSNTGHSIWQKPINDEGVAIALDNNQMVISESIYYHSQRARIFKHLISSYKLDKPADELGKPIRQNEFVKFFNQEKSESLSILESYFKTNTNRDKNLYTKIVNLGVLVVEPLLDRLNLSLTNETYDILKILDDIDKGQKQKKFFLQGIGHIFLYGNETATPALLRFLSDKESRWAYPKIIAALGKIAPDQVISKVNAQLNLSLSHEFYDSSHRFLSMREIAPRTRSVIKWERSFEIVKYEDKYVVFFTSDKIGGNFDLWVAFSKDKITWEKPLFTGLHVNVELRNFEEAMKPKFSIKNNEITVEWTGWDKVKKYNAKIPTQRFIKQVSFDDIKKDSDNDGLTDLVENRLQTSVLNPDTDGDGINDYFDKSPLVKHKKVKINDAEKIKQSAFQALFSIYNDKNVVLTNPDDYGDFGLIGYSGKLLVMDNESTKIFRSEVGYGVTTFNFGSPDYDFDDKEIEVEEEIIYQGDEAKIGVRFYWAPRSALGQDITLKKIKGVWVVVKIQRTWRS